MIFIVFSLWRLSWSEYELLNVSFWSINWGCALSESNYFLMKVVEFSFQIHTFIISLRLHMNLA